MANIGDVIAKDLKALPWLKVYSVNERKLSVIYIDEIRGDLYERYLTYKDRLGLFYIGHITFYNVIKLDKKEN